MFANLLFSLKSYIPKPLLFKLRRVYYFLLNNLHPRISETEFRKLLVEKMGIKKGSVIYIHSSVDRMFLGFPYFNLLPMLREIVGPEGTLLFPGSHIKGRAEDFLQNPDAVFDVQRSVTVRGILPEIARTEEDAVRSLHPTNSVTAIGRHAGELTGHHHETIYPCGEKSPFYEITRYDGIIVGLGTDVDHLSFVHAVEDVMKKEFPFKTRNDRIYECRVIDKAGNLSYVKTLVASREIEKRNVPGFMRLYVPENICHRFTYKRVRFFRADSVKLFERMAALAKEGKTIYLK